MRKAPAAPRWWLEKGVCHREKQCKDCQTRRQEERNVGVFSSLLLCFLGGFSFIEYLGDAILTWQEGTNFAAIAHHIEAIGIDYLVRPRRNIFAFTFDVA